MDILAELNRQDGITVLVSLHQVEYALAYCPRTIALRRRQVVYDGPSEALTPAFLSELYGAESEELFLPGLSPRKHRASTDHRTTRSARPSARPCPGLRPSQRQRMADACTADQSTCSRAERRSAPTQAD